MTVIASPVSYLTGKKTSPSAQEPDRQLKDQPITILRAATYTKYNKSFFHRVLSFFSFMLSSFFIALKVPKPDVVWGTSPPIFQGFTAWLIARLKRSRFLFEVRDLWPAFAIALGVIKNPILKSLSCGLEKFLYKHADCVVVNSPGFIDHVKSLGAKRVELIPNGANPAMFKSKDRGRTFRESYRLGGKFVVTYAGAHGISNDLETVLNAAIQISQLHRIQILLVGDGKEKRALMQKAAIFDLPNVLFLDPLPKNQIADLLAASDACLAILKPIELYKTTYPNKVFDYMAAGKPVICAIDGEIRKVVEAAGAGVYVEPGNADMLAGVFKNLAKDRPLCRRMGRAGRDYLNKYFERNQISKDFEKIFLSL